ncbi:putative alpha-galactosidase a [Diaporthe ampelina]|uniref:Putative alpha-galactosidase a n=1 Tax=Diaporthe ampelina TaxID=1214573 RepID=A0A0G2H9G0_9PEZI|nr:putative alpha-galactosidase a [Diaporthe ampelina]
MQSTQSTTMVHFTIDGVLTGTHPSSPDLYRIRIQPADAAAGGPTIKYLTASNTTQILTGPDAHVRPLDNLAFDKVPAGNWVVGRLVLTEEGTDGQGGRLELASTETDTAAALDGLGLYSAEPVFCGTTVDQQDCQGTVDSPPWTTVVNADGKEVNVPKPTDLQCMDYVSASIVATPPGVATEAREVIRVTDWIPDNWVGIETDVRAHQTVQARDPGLVPRLVAHVTENHSRVVGFLLEHIAGAREAGTADLDACKAALARLHALGIAKGPLSRHSFLDDKGIEEAMRAEKEGLEEVLAWSPSVFEDQAAAMLRRVDPRRESQKGGARITLTVEQHGVLSEGYKANGFRWTDELQEQAEKRFGPSAEAV